MRQLNVFSQDDLRDSSCGDTRDFSRKIKRSSDPLALSPQEIANVLIKYEELLKIELGDDLDSLYLFGSVARGEYSEGSDIDVGVVLEYHPFSGLNSFRRVTDISSDVSLEFGVHLTDFQVSKEMFETVDRQLYLDIKEEGILLYKKRGN